MLFSTITFIFIYLPLVLLFFLIVKKFYGNKISIFILIFSSLFFYAWFSIKFLFLLLFSIIFNYLIIKKFKTQNSLLLLISAIMVNLFILGYFKYRNFFLENLELVSNFSFTYTEIFIPLGISFFTFQQIAVLLDSYDKRANVENFKEYFFFVSFFPQLVAGPIVLFGEMKNQIDNFLEDKNHYLYITQGFTIFIFGLFKKIVIADSLGVYVDQGFEINSIIRSFEAWILVISYTLQIFFDFSGYSDMAIGLALMFGFRLPINFDNPFISLSIVEFWRRWHITMSRFFMMYIYSPLALYYARKTVDKNKYLIFFLTVFVPTIFAFFCAGLWHGAHWKFAVYGLVNGLAIAIAQFWKEQIKINLFKEISWFLTMLTIIISFVFFRSIDIPQSILILKSMFFLNGYDLTSNFVFQNNLFLKDSVEMIRCILLISLCLLYFKFIPEISKQKSDLKINIKLTFLSSLMLIISLILIDRPQPFIYFQF